MSLNDRQPVTDAMREDARLQPDPELQMSGGHRAGPWQIAFVIAAGFVLVFGTLYGINNQRTEADLNAGAGTAATQPPAPTTDNKNVAGGEAKDQQAQREGKGGAPAGTPETTGAGQKTEQAPDAQPEPAKPTTSGSQR